jgi:hypothetical protein
VSDEKKSQLHVKFDVQPDDTPQEIAEGIWECMASVKTAILLTAEAEGKDIDPDSIVLDPESLVGESPNEQAAMEIIKERLARGEKL